MTTCTVKGCTAHANPTAWHVCREHRHTIACQCPSCTGVRGHKSVRADVQTVVVHGPASCSCLAVATRVSLPRAPWDNPAYQQETAQ